MLSFEKRLRKTQFKIILSSTKRCLAYPSENLTNFVLIKSYKLFDNEADIKKAIPLGSKKMVRIGERRICIFHLESGFKVFNNLCPHNGHSLLDGLTNYLEEVVCPLHGYRFSLNDGKESESRCLDLTIHQIDITNSGVFLRLSP